MYVCIAACRGIRVGTNITILSFNWCRLRPQDLDPCITEVPSFPVTNIMSQDTRSRTLLP